MVEVEMIGRALKLGDKLSNGAVVMAYRDVSFDRRIVLALFRRTEYVTWRLDYDNNPWGGHYFEGDLVAAAMDFLSR
jgi:hypothetical protein